MTDLFAKSGDQPTVTIDPNKKYLEELVGETKKFKDTESLARGKYEADQTIEHFKQVQDEMRADLLKFQEEAKSRATLEQLIEKLQTPATTSTTTTNAENVNEPINLDEFEQNLFKKLEKKELDKREQANSKAVQDKLIERFGTNYQTVLNKQRESLGLDMEDINALARKSPEAFFRAIGLSETKAEDSFQAPPRSSQRSDNFAPTTEKRTWSWYQRIKKENPKLYWDPKTITQRHKDAETLGEEFMDGDWAAYQRI